VAAYGEVFMATVNTSRQGRYHNHRFRTLAEELGLQVQRDSTFGWTQTNLRASTVVAYSGVFGELEQHVPRAAAQPARANARAMESGPLRVSVGTGL
jgi:hypothetical protein